MSLERLLALVIIDKDLPEPRRHMAIQVIGAIRFAARQIQEGPDLLRAAKAVYVLPDRQNLERLREAIQRAETADAQ